MVFDILNSPIALLCPVRYQILADIESFALLLYKEMINSDNLIPPYNLMFFEM